MAGQGERSDEAIERMPVDPVLSQLLLESTPHSIAVFDSELKLVYANENFFRFMRSVFKRDFRPGQKILEALPQDRALKWQLRLQEVLGGQCTRLEEALEVDGQTRYFDVAYQPVNDEDHLDRIVIHFEEITARKRREKRLLDREVELEQSISTRETLLSVISHDLRSPIFQLNGLLFMIQQASETRDEARLQLYAEDLEERISHLTHTLDNLLSWSNLQRQDLKPQVRRFSLQSVFDDAVGLMKPVTQHKGVKIDIQKVAGVEPVTDREMVAFIARNLINNAIKFSNQGGKIEVIAEGNEDAISFTILDHGVGIEEKRIEGLRQGSEAFTEAGTWGERGTGLGLKTCFDFVERLKGSIEFHSSKGTGTSVTVQLPNLDPTMGTSPVEG